MTLEHLLRPAAGVRARPALGSGGRATALLRPLLLALALAAAPACDGGSPSTPPPPAERDLAWLRQNAVPLRTVQPGGDYADLAPLRQMVGSARMVGLGEGTHGTREFFLMKHRLVEFLVKEMGFNTFGLEATWAETNRINDYVHGGPGNPRAFLSGTYFWTWNTQEVLDLIEWMRRHNQNPGSAPKVSFLGFDMQYSRVTMSDVEAFLAKADPAARDSARAHYACYRKYQDNNFGSNPNYSGAPPEDRTACRAGVQAVHSLLERNRERFTRAASAAEYERALRGARIVVQNEDTRSAANATEGSLARDRYMAENSAWLLDQAGPGGKVVLWAHNYHVSNQVGAQGFHLRQKYGRDYVNLGFAFDRGVLNAMEQTATGSFTGLKAMSVPPAPEGTYEAELRRLGQPRFLVDLRPIEGSPPASAAWLAGPLSFRSIGSVFRPTDPGSYFALTRLAATYDLLVWVEETSATVLLPFVLE